LFFEKPCPKPLAISQPPPPKPLEPVTTRKFFVGIVVRPATTLNETDAPDDPETKILSVRSSSEKDSDPLRMK